MTGKPRLQTGKARHSAVRKAKYGPPLEAPKKLSAEQKKRLAKQICRNIRMYLRLLILAHQRPARSKLRFG